MQLGTFIIGIIQEILLKAIPFVASCSPPFLRFISDALFQVVLSQTHLTYTTHENLETLLQETGRNNGLLNLYAAKGIVKQQVVF